MEDTYYQEDIPLFTGTSAYYRNKPQQIRAKIHTSQERYSDVSFEIVPITTPKGERTYINIHPYVAEPNIVLSVELHSEKHYADMEPSIGKVQETQVQGFRHFQIGNVQAWYYPADKALVIWECYFHSFFRGETKLTDDTTTRQLWQHIQQTLHAKFPQAERIVTPFSDPQWDIEEYQTFLRSLGYEPVAKAAYGKLL